MKTQLKYISPASVILSSLSLSVIVLGLIMAVLTYIVFPDYTAALFSVKSKLIAIGTYTIVYSITVLSAIVVGAFIYNMFCAMGVKGITLGFEGTDEK